MARKKSKKNKVTWESSNENYKSLSSGAYPTKEYWSKQRQQENEKKLQKKRQDEQISKTTKVWRESAAHEQNVRGDGVAPTTYATKMARDKYAGLNNYLDSLQKKRTEANKKLAQDSTYIYNGKGEPGIAYQTVMRGGDSAKTRDYLNSLVRKEKEDKLIKNSAKQASQPIIETPIEEKVRQTPVFSSTSLYKEAPKLPNKQKQQEKTTKARDIQDEIEEYVTGLPKEKRENSSDRELWAGFVESKYNDIESGKYNGGSDLALMNAAGLNADEAKWKQTEDRLTAQRNAVNQSLQSKLNWQPTSDKWGAVYDFVEGWDENNERNILNRDTATQAEKDNAERLLGNLEGTSEERRNLALTNAGSYYQTEYRQREYSDDEAGVNMRRADAYNSAFRDGKTYEDRVAEMSDEEVAQLNTLIDEATGAWENPYNPEEQRAVMELNRGIKHAQEKQKQNAAEKNRRENLAKLQALTAGGDATFDNSMLPEPQVVYDENLGYDVIVPQGTEIEKSAFYINNRDLLTAGENSATDIRKEYFLTPGMKDDFFILFKQDQLNGTNNAQAYLDGLDGFLSYCVMEKREANARSVADIPVVSQIASAMTYPMNAVGGMIGTIGTIAGGLGDKAGQDPSSDYYAITNWVNAFREEKGENWGDFAASVFGEDAREYGQFARNMLYSFGDNLFSTATGTALSGGSRELAMKFVQMLMSSEAISSKMVEELTNHREPTEAALLAIGDGVIEWLTEEHISLETIMDPNMKEMIGNKVAHLKHLLKSSAAEGSEELASFTLGHAYDALVSRIAGHEDEVEARYWELRETMTDKEAEQQVLKELFRDGGMQTLAGALSGGVMELGYYGVNKRQQGKIGTEIRNAETSGAKGQDVVLDAALGMKDDTQSHQIAQEIRDKQEAGKEPSAFDLGRLVQNMQMETSESASRAAEVVIVEKARELLANAEMSEVEKDEMSGILANAVLNGVDVLSKEERKKLMESKAGFNAFRQFLVDSEASRDTIGRIMDRTRVESEAQQSVSELLNKDVRQQTQNAEDAGETFATEEDKSRATGTAVTGSRGVIVDGQWAKLGQLKRVTEGEGDNKKVSYKWTVTVDGKEQTVDASQIKATDFATASIIRQAQVNPGMFSNGFTNTLLQANENGEIKNVGRFLLEAQRIRIASYIGQRLPMTTMQRGTAQAIFDQAKYEHGKNREEQVTARKTDGKVTLLGAEYGTDAWNKKLESIKDPHARAQIETIAGLFAPEGIAISFRSADEMAEEYERLTGEKEDGTMIYGEERAEGITKERPEAITINIEGLDYMKGKNGEKVIKGKHNMMVTFGHEATHYLQRHSMEGYNQLESYVLNRLRDNGMDVGRRVMEVMNSRDLNIEDAISEIVADSCDQILANEEVANHIRETNQSLFKEIKGFVTDLVGRVRDAIKGMKESGSRESNVISLRSTNELARIWLGAYDEAISGEIRREEGTSNGNVRNSRADIDWTDEQGEVTQKQIKTDQGKYNKADLYNDEGLYSYDFLTKLHPIKVSKEIDMTGIVSGKNINYGNLVKAGKQNALANGGTPLHDGWIGIVNEYTGKELRITNNSIEHSTHSINNKLSNVANARAGAIVGELAKYGVPINALNNDSNSQDLIGTYAIAAPVVSEDGKKAKIAVLTVEIHSGNVEELNVYDLVHSTSIRKKNEGNGTTAETAAPSDLAAQRAVTSTSHSSRISITDMLHIVNSTHKGLLSDNVLGKLGEQKPEKGYWAERSRFSMADLDSEYQTAVESGDLAHAEEMLLEKLQRTEGIIPFNAPHGYGGQHKDIAKMIKDGTPEVVARAAADMAQYVPDNAVLIPIPPHEGTVTESTDTMILARAIGELTGRPVVNALGSNERESRYQAKSENRKGVSAEEMGFRQIADIPEGTMPIFIDNVVGSGETAKAARNALGGGITLSYAKSTRSQGIEGLKRATVTYDKEGKLIPMSQRFDVSKRDTRYSKANLAELDAEYMQAVKDGNEQRQQELVDQAAKDNGYTMKVYHGTPYGGFTQFRDWSYFTQNKDYADRYNHPSQSSTRGRYDAATQPMTYGLYMNPGRVFDTRQPEARELFNQIRMEQGMSELTERGLPDWTDGRDLIDYIEENNLPYDTIILDEGADGGYGEPVVPRGESYVTRSNMVKSADPATRDDNGNVIPLSKRFKKENNDIRFSMAEPVETTKDLIAVHNLEADQLMKILRLGGFAMPSIAIIRDNYAHNRYGGVSVLFRKDTIDPQMFRSNKVYGGDAWTPTYPSVEYKLNEKEFKNIRKRIESLVPADIMRSLQYQGFDTTNMQRDINSFRGDIATALKDKMLYQMAYLADKGEEIEYPMKEQRLDRSGNFQNSQVLMVLDMLGEEAVEQAYSEGYRYIEEHPDMVEQIRQALNNQFREENKGAKLKLLQRDLYSQENFGMNKVYNLIDAAGRYLNTGLQQELDENALKDRIKQQVSEDEGYIPWLNDLFSGIIEKRGLRNNKSFYTNSGNPRSWEALHDEETLENVVRIMKEQADKGEAAFFSQSALLALGTRDFRSIDDIRAHKGQLKHLTDEEMSAAKTEIINKVSEIQEEIKDKSERNDFIARDRALQAIAEAVRRGKTVQAIDRELRQWNGLTIHEDTAQRIVEVMQEIADLPTEYFEAKPQRAVGLDEIATVILPEDTDQSLIDALEERKIPYETYNGTDEDRLRVMNEQEDVKFSKYTSETMDVTAWMMAQSPGSVQTEAERQLLEDYRGLRIKISLSIKRQLDYKAEIKKLEDHLADLTPAQKEDLAALYTKLQTQQEKQADLENELYKVTSSEGYAGMMRHYNIVLNDFITGKTQDQVRESVEQMIDQVKASEKIIEKQAKMLRKMAESQAVKAVSSMINKKSLNYAVKSLKESFNTSMGKTELESRLTEMALKRANGEDITEDARELAIDMTNQMRGYQNDVLERMRGVTIVIGPDQKAEMKGNGMTLQSVREQLRGTGVKVKYGDYSSLDTDTVDGGDLRTLLPELPQDIGENSGDALFKFISWAQSMRDTDQGMKQEMVDIEDAAVSTLAIASTIEVNMNSPEYRKQNQIAVQTMQIAGELEQAGRSMTEKTEEAGLRARGWASTLQRDVNEAIKYYNTIARKAAQEEKNKVRKNVIEQLKSQHTADLIKQEQKYKEMMKNDRKARMTAEDIMTIRNGINTVASRVRKRMMEETDAKNIPEEAKPLARQMLKMLVQHDFVGYRHVLFASKQMREQTMAALDSWEKRDGAFKEEDLDWLIVGRGENADYDIRDHVEQALIDIESGLLEYRTAEGRGHITLMDRKAALKKVDNAVEQIWSVIAARETANLNYKQMLVSELAMQARDDMQHSRFKGEWTGKIGHGLGAIRSGVVYGNMTPEYFFKNLRNRTISQLYDEYHRAENRNGLEVGKAKAALAKIAEETGYSTWDQEKRYTFQLEKGGTVSLTLGEMMSLYATWQREAMNQAELNGPEKSFHLEVGGFYTAQEEEHRIIGREKFMQKAHRLTGDDIAKIRDSMTPEQLDYVERVVRYMTEDIGALGNEASMRMYGIKKYNEKWYFPFEIWSGVKSKKSDQGAAGSDENRAAHASFSKRRRSNANNALVIRDFTETAVKHIGQMINYNTFAPAIEFMNRVMNYQLTEEGEGEDSTTKRNLRTIFGEIYGKDAIDYLDNFNKDVNGGVVRGDVTVYDKLLSTFKKSAVAGSLSVAFQQPLSYIRASMMISPKYLAAAINPAYYKGSRAEMEKYSGVAVIKAMGKFDMNFGQSARDYMMPDRKVSRGRAIYNKASDAATALPGAMDTMTWTRMWTACKLEQQARNPGMDFGSREFMEKVAERFNDVMRKTQVYDSMLVKSKNMRSQNVWMKSLTSFMAEPTLTANVLADAVANFKEKGGKANLAKAGATFLISAVMQAIVKGLFGAGRSPDEKKTWDENVAYRFAYNFMNEVNPMSLIPGYSDVIALLKDGELQDDAMSVVGKILTAAQTTIKMASGKSGNVYRDIEDSVGQLAQLFTNIPTKNIMRDARAIYNYFTSPYAVRDKKSDPAVLKYQLADQFFNADNLLGVVNKWLGEDGWQTNNTAYYKRIYAADKAGKKQKVDDMIKYLKLARNTKQEKIEQEVRKLIKADDSLTSAQSLAKQKEYGLKSGSDYITSEYKEGNMDRKTAEDLYRKENPKADNKKVYEHFDQIDYKKSGKLSEGEYYSSYNLLYDAIDSGNQAEIRSTVKKMISYGYKQENIKKQLTTKYKQEYIDASVDGRRQMQNKLVKVYKEIGVSSTEAAKIMQNWVLDNNKKKNNGKK